VNHILDGIEKQSSKKIIEDTDKNTFILSILKHCSPVLEIAIARAFKRYIGEPPAHWRDQMNSKFN